MIELSSYVWDYNEELNRFEYDCKAYVKDNKLYWKHNDKYVRDLDSKEILLLEEYKICFKL